MKKYIIFSFDDGREDTYRNAYKVLSDKSLPATINVTSDFILHEEKYTCFKSSCNKSMKISEILECQKAGWEIACHGSKHQNDVEDIVLNISELEAFGVDVNNIGFASPNAEVTEDNCKDIHELLDNNTIAYIRSGRQTRREGIWYSVWTIINQYLKSKYVYWCLNKRNILYNNNKRFLYSVGISSYTTIKELKYLISRIKKDEAIILVFHSILKECDRGYNLDKWYWDIEKFEELCDWISHSSQFEVCTTKQWLELKGDKNHVESD